MQYCNNRFPNYFGDMKKKSYSILIAIQLNKQINIVATCLSSKCKGHFKVKSSCNNSPIPVLTGQKNVYIE